MAVLKGAGDACQLDDGGAWNTALAYIQTRPMAERKDLSEALTAGFAGGFSVSKDRNYPAVCRTTVADIMGKVGDAKAFLQREIGRTGGR
jgi:hypothetical protein